MISLSETTIFLYETRLAGVLILVTSGQPYSYPPPEGSSLVSQLSHSTNSLSSAA